MTSCKHGEGKKVIYSSLLTLKCGSGGGPERGDRIGGGKWGKSAIEKRTEGKHAKTERGKIDRTTTRRG